MAIKLGQRLPGRLREYAAVTSFMRSNAEKITKIEFVKGPDNTALVIMAVTVETPEVR